MKKTLLAKSVAIHGSWCCIAFLVACGISSVASARTQTIRIVTYNMDADQGQNGAGFTIPQPGLITPASGGSVTNGGVLEGIGEEIVNGDPAQPIDILALEETTSNTTTVQPIMDGLNTFYSVHGPAAGYAMSPHQATESFGDPTFGNGPNALVYNTNTVQLLASVPVDPPGGTNTLGSISGEYREVMRYKFAPADATPAANNEFYIYVSHYKASTGSLNASRRLGEAIIIRNDEADNLPADARVIYLGDYNPTGGSGEPAYQTIISNSAPNGAQQGQGFDPLNPSRSTNIDWGVTTTDTNILFMLTESAPNVRFRDDLQVMTSNVFYGVAGGLQYVPGTYHTFGNNATIPWGSSVLNPSNTALSGIPSNALISAAQCYTNLTTATDHLPVVADYTIFADSGSLIVTNTGDGVGDEGTLRQALSLANSGDTISFDVPLPATIHLQQGAMLLDTDVTILGPGADKLVISGDGTNRVFQNDGFIVAISGVTLSNGVDRADGVGGAIANFGTLTISECTLKNNLARGPDGHGVGGGGGGAGGGAIFNGMFSTLFVVNSTFSDNQTIGGGGHRAGGGSGGAFGGAIFNLDGFVVASNCTFSANLAIGGTSGVADDGEEAGDGGSGINSFSGGIGFHDFPDGSDGNDAEDIGGGGGAAADGEQSTGVCNGGNGGHGGAGGFGGGGGVGGNGANGCLVAIDGDGGNGGNGGNGGDGEFGGGGAGAGAGGHPTGVGTLTGSAGTPGLGGLGAGSGVSTNGGGGAGFGGAIFSFQGNVQIVNCTIASNSVAGGGSIDHLADGTGIGGGIYNDGGDFQVLNTIIAGNVADTADDVGSDGDITSNGHNLIGIGNGSSGFTNGVNGDLAGSTNAPLDAKLGPLANNGGPTFTRALLAGSPAIDGGSDRNCSPTDQRGAVRPSGLHCDIGAFELDNPPVAICGNVTASLVSGCSTNVSINNGSFDPDAGDTITLSQSPAGPYPRGVTTVTLTVTDGIGATNSCTATVTVVDNIPPSITCPSNKTVSAASPAGVVVTFADPAVSDNCGATVSCVPPSGSTFPIGDTTVLCTATDVAGNMNSCTFSVHVKDASEQLSDAGLLILGQGIDLRIKKNVLKKFQKIERQIDVNRTRNACKQLQALLRQIERDLFKERLTSDQAIQITTPLVRVLTVLSCP